MYPRKQNVRIPKILVVDDNPSDILLLRHAVARVNIPAEIQSVSDGNEVLPVLQAEGGADLLVLDFALPGMTALDILQAVRSDTKLKSTPAIVLSGLLAPAQQQAVTSLGALYVEKPFSLHAWAQIANQIRSLLASPIAATAA
jgi:CheY-like chemotaxis protein